MALGTQTKLWLKGLFGVHASSTVDVDDAVNRMYRGTVKHTIVANANANTSTATTYFWTAHTNVKVVNAEWIGDTAITSTNTNYCVFNLLKGNGTAAAATVVGKINMTPDTVTNVAIATPYNFTLTAANVNVNAGQVLACNISKPGTGLAVGIGTIVVHYEER